LALAELPAKSAKIVLGFARGRSRLLSRPGSMLRTIAIIASAIMLSRPGMPAADAETYAKLLQKQAKQHRFDPLTGVALIHFESGWYPEAISPNREDYGLGQIRARYVGACRKDADPLNEPSAECRAVKRTLLEPETNIRTMAELITNNRKLCKEKTGTALVHQWLASYQGSNFPKQKRWCVPTRKTWDVVAYRKKLIRELVLRKPSK
jgi:hypothetical protein